MNVTFVVISGKTGIRPLWLSLKETKKGERGKGRINLKRVEVVAGDDD